MNVAQKVVKAIALDVFLVPDAIPADACLLRQMANNNAVFLNGYCSQVILIAPPMFQL